MNAYGGFAKYLEALKLSSTPIGKREAQELAESLGCTIIIKAPDQIP